MGQLIVRNIENGVKARLQRRAKRHGRSMEEEVRDILRNAANEDEEPAGKLGSEIAGLFQKLGLKTDIHEARGHKVKAVRIES